jgi:hypothetical protein
MRGIITTTTKEWGKKEKKNDTKISSRDLFRLNEQEETE